MIKVYTREEGERVLIRSSFHCFPGNRECLTFPPVVKTVAIVKKLVAGWKNDWTPLPPERNNCLRIKSNVISVKMLSRSITIGYETENYC